MVFHSTDKITVLLKSKLYDSMIRCLAQCILCKLLNRLSCLGKVDSAAVFPWKTCLVGCDMVTLALMLFPACKISCSRCSATILLRFAFRTFFQMKHLSLLFPTSGFLLTLQIIKKKKNKNRKRWHATLLSVTWQCAFSCLFAVLTIGTCCHEMSQDSFTADELFQGLICGELSYVKVSSCCDGLSYFKLCLYYTIVYNKGEPAVVVFLFCFVFWQYD